MSTSHEINGSKNNSTDNINQSLDMINSNYNEETLSKSNVTLTMSYYDFLRLKSSVDSWENHKQKNRNRYTPKKNPRRQCPIKLDQVIIEVDDIFTDKTINNKILFNLGSHVFT